MHLNEETSLNMRPMMHLWTGAFLNGRRRGVTGRWCHLPVSISSASMLLRTSGKTEGQRTEWVSVSGTKVKTSLSPRRTCSSPQRRHHWLPRLGGALVDRASQYNTHSCITVISALRSKNLIKLGSTPADVHSSRCHSNSSISGVSSRETLMSCTCSSRLLHPSLLSHLMMSLSFIPSGLSSTIIRSFCDSASRQYLDCDQKNILWGSGWERLNLSWDHVCLSQQHKTPWVDLQVLFWTCDSCFLLLWLYINALSWPGLTLFLTPSEAISNHVSSSFNASPQFVESVFPPSCHLSDPSSPQLAWAVYTSAASDSRLCLSYGRSIKSKSVMLKHHKHIY